MKRSPGFTLLELVMAISFAGFIIVGLIQAMRSSAGFLATGRKFMQVDRKVALLFNQLEQDLSCAFIPTLQRDPSDDEETRKLKKEVIHFTAKAEADFTKIGGERRYRLKDASWVTTNVLRFGRKEPRLARVRYELKKDVLIRKETSQLDNVKFEEPDPAYAEASAGMRDGKRKTVRSAIVCNNVKNLFVECVVPRKRTEKDDTAVIKKKPEEEPPLRTYTWGDTDETKNAVPQYVRVYLELFDDKKKRTFSYETMIAIAAFTKPKTVPKPEDGAQEGNEGNKEENKKEPQKAQEPGAQKPPAPAPAAPESNDISSYFNSLNLGQK